MNKEVVVRIHNVILLSHKKEHLWVNPNEMDEPRIYYTKWSMNVLKVLILIKTEEEHRCL